MSSGKLPLLFDYSHCEAGCQNLFIMPSIVSIAVQSALLKAAANITAQTITRPDTSPCTPLDWTRIAEFAVFGIVSAPLASLWQQLLEENFPSQRNVGLLSPLDSMTDRTGQKPTRREEEERRLPGLNWANILIKLLLDQTLGQLIINTAFLVCTNAARLQNAGLIAQEIQTRILGILFASWKIWPLVALVNFVWVPVEWRVVVASFVDSDGTSL